MYDVFEKQPEEILFFKVFQKERLYNSNLSDFSSLQREEIRSIYWAYSIEEHGIN